MKYVFHPEALPEYTEAVQYMRRDSIFYKLFQQSPTLLFELVANPPTNSDRYRFDCVAVKEPKFEIAFCATIDNFYQMSIAIARDASIPIIYSFKSDFSLPSTLSE